MLRSEILTTMSALKLYGMKAAYDAERYGSTPQELLNGTADYVFDTFGAGAVNELFVGQGTDGAAAGDNGRIGDIVLRDPPVGEAALFLVANAYGTSASETISAEPAPLVDAEDIIAAAHDDAKNCLLVGTQCTDDSSVPASAAIARYAASTRPWRGSPKSPRSHNSGATSVQPRYRIVAG